MHDHRGAELNSTWLPQDTPTTDNIIYSPGTRLNPTFNENVQHIDEIMLSVWTLIAAAICAVPVSAMSRRNLIHGRQLFLDLPERTERLDFTSADETDQFTIWEHRSLSLWPSKPSKGQVNSASHGWSFTIRHVTFDDEGTYTLRNHFGSTISSYTVKVNTNREIIERIAGEKLIIPLLGLKQSDATLRFYGNYSSVILVENGVPVGKNKPDYINRLKVTSEMIQVLNVNVSDLGRYELTDSKGRPVSNNTMVLVDQHAHNPSQGFLALLLFGIPCGGICFCCRRRICNRCRTTKSQTVESNVLNTVPVSSNTVINPVGPIGPGGPGQGYIAGYPPHPDQGQIHHPPPTEWSGQPAVSPNPGFHPVYVPQNPVYPPDFGSGVPPAQPPQWNAPPTQYNPSAPVNYTPVMYSAPPGPEAAGFKMNEPSPTAPLLTPQPESHQSVASVSMDILNSGESSVQFDINKGKSSGSNFL